MSPKARQQFLWPQPGLPRGSDNAPYEQARRTCRLLRVREYVHCTGGHAAFCPMVAILDRWFPRRTFVGVLPAVVACGKIAKDLPLVLLMSLQVNLGVWRLRRTRLMMTCRRWTRSACWCSIPRKWTTYSFARTSAENTGVPLQRTALDSGACRASTPNCCTGVVDIKQRIPMLKKSLGGWQACPAAADGFKSVLGARSGSIQGSRLVVTACMYDASGW